MRSQPGPEIGNVWRCEQGIKRITAPRWVAAVDHCQQMQIVIAEDYPRRRTQPPDPTQHSERTRPTVHQIADEPGAIAVPIELHCPQQRHQFGVAALHVTDRVSRHGRAANERRSAV